MARADRQERSNREQKEDPELIEKQCLIFKSGGTWEELLEEEGDDEVWDNNTP